MSLSARAHAARRFIALAMTATLALVAIGVPPAAAVTRTALINDATVIGGMTSLEAQAAVAAGFTVTVVSDGTWASMTADQFGTYDLLIAGDPSCGVLPPGLVTSASVWGPVVLGTAGGRTQAGNRIVVGTDPVFHQYSGGSTLVYEGIAFAGKQPGRTGMYLDTTCAADYFGQATETLSLLAAISSGSGTWTINADPPCGGSVSLVASVPGSFPTLTTGHLQGWGCSVHESFPTFTTDYSALAVATDTPTHPTCGVDPNSGLSACGEAYILVAGSGISVISGSISLSPLDGTNPVGTDHTVTATVTDANGPLAGQVVTWTVTGVNVGATGTCVPVSCATDADGVVTFTYTGANGPGDDTIKASFTDATGSLQSATAQKHWERSANTPPTAGAGGPYSGDEGSPIAISGASSDADVADAVTTTWSYSPVTADPGASCSFADAANVSTTVTCTDDGTYSLTLTADDGVNPPVASSPATLTVANVAPDVTIAGPAEGALYAVGATVPLSAPFTDAGSNDTHACTVGWDDGTNAGIDPATSPCSASKVFANPGVYTITVTVADDDGASDAATVMIIVYDPSAGFVTGGGTIESPEGAYRPDPVLSGKANFGFVSKYKKGATVPTGATEFQFHAGSFNFHSDTYQWLVVAGCKAQYKGTGTVNGVGGYGFILTATDGILCATRGPDKFRIKVWDTATGDVVYDNNLGTSDDIDVAYPQTIATGSIVIHKGK